MTIEAALVREQGQTFAVVVVRRGVIDNRLEADRARASFGPAFNHVPVVLMEQDHRGTPRYYGRNDIVRFLATSTSGVCRGRSGILIRQRAG